jgi:hypothetical protein
MMNRRNKPCPCGSGKKFKRCCINMPLTWNEPELRSEEYAKALKKDLAYSKKIGKEHGLLKGLVGK